MVDIVVLLIILVIIVVIYFIVMHKKKKNFDKESVHIIGWRKKNRVMFSDERLKPVYRKVCVWESRLSMYIGIALGLSIPSILRGDPEWLGVFIIFGIGAAGAIFSAIMRRKRLAEFYKFTDELGVILERDKDIVEKARTENFNRTIKAKKVSYVWRVIAFAILFYLNLISSNGDFIMAILCISVGGFYLYLLIKLHRLKKKSGKIEDDSET